MLILIQTKHVSATLWDPSQKQIYSTQCRPSCLVCKISVGILKFMIGLYRAHRVKEAA